MLLWFHNINFFFVLEFSSTLVLFFLLMAAATSHYRVLALCVSLSLSPSMLSIRLFFVFYWHYFFLLPRFSLNQFAVRSVLLCFAWTLSESDISFSLYSSQIRAGATNFCLLLQHNCISCKCALRWCFGLYRSTPSSLVHFVHATNVMQIEVQ